MDEKKNAASRPPTLAEIVSAARRLARAEFHKSPCDELNQVCVKLEVCEKLLAEIQPAVSKDVDRPAAA